MLKEDPASAWLSPSARWRVKLAGYLFWPAVSLAFVLCGVIVLPVIYRVFVFLPHSWLVWGAYLIYIAFNLLLFAQARQIVRRFQTALTLSMVRKTASADALSIDDFDALAAEPDGRAVSLVGWVRARSTLRYKVDGKSCVGFALGCRTKIKEYRVGDPGGYGFARFGAWRGRYWVNTFETPYSGLMETMQDFDLVDDQGRSLPIQAAGARLIASSNASILGDDVEGQLLISTLDLPLSVEPFPWDSYVLRDGDPIMVVGFKTTIVDPSQPGMRQVPVRTVIASAGARPLLVYPILPILPIPSDGKPPAG